jgi:hypothetical protein
MAAPLGALQFAVLNASIGLRSPTIREAVSAVERNVRHLVDLTHKLEAVALIHTTADNPIVQEVSGTDGRTGSRPAAAREGGGSWCSDSDCRGFADAERGRGSPGTGLREPAVRPRLQVARPSTQSIELLESCQHVSIVRSANAGRRRVVERVRAVVPGSCPARNGWSG